jgi:hypothetical protein
MKKFLLTLTLALAPLSASAETFKYTEMCWYFGKQNHPWIEQATCTITDIRSVEGFLDKRIIQARVNSSGITYTVKSWFDNRGFMTWDSDSQTSYQRPYQVASPTAGVIQQANLPKGYGITEVTKELWVRQIPWD